jgi:hypothetical protein
MSLREWLKTTREHGPPRKEIPSTLERRNSRPMLQHGGSLRFPCAVKWASEKGKCRTSHSQSNSETGGSVQGRGRGVTVGWDRVPNVEDENVLENDGAGNCPGLWCPQRHWTVQVYRIVQVRGMAHVVQHLPHELKGPEFKTLVPKKIK